MNENLLYNLKSFEFFELIDNAKINLKFKNNTYKNLFDEMEKIKNGHPNLQKIFEESDEDIEINITKDEMKMLHKLLNLQLEIRSYEDQEIFFQGAKEA
ncbi:MAG: hypothetical protein IJ220_05975 [Clostridia bacterium]|nr:hypothetical protein [Clostridia bacterium]